MGERDQRASIEVGPERVPIYPFPEDAVRALGHVTAYARWRGQSPGLPRTFDDLRIDEAKKVCRDALEQRGETWLTADEIRRVLTAFGLPLLPGSVAHTAAEAAALAATMGYPVVAKTNSPTILHKTDVGAVRVNLADGPSVERAFRDITDSVINAFPDSATDGVLIQPMVAGGIETMMGLTEDPVFGPIVAFGLGGIFVELLADVRFRIAPLTDRDADELLHGIKGFPILNGYRGRAAADLDALRELLLRLSRLADEIPEVAELDLNPVMALAPGNGCRIVDARIRVTSVSVR
jgi:acyl-CoA synthetase (NDP forming)